MLNDIQEAEIAVMAKQKQPKGCLNITAPVLFGQRHVNPLVLRFLEQHREMHVSLMLLDREVNLVDEGFDVAVRIAQLADSSYVARPVGVIPMVVCASPILLAKTRIPQHPKDLKKLPCVGAGGKQTVTTWRFMEQGRLNSMPVDGPFLSNQVTTTIDACLHGLGYGQFFYYQVRPLLDQGKLIRVLQEFELPPFPVNILYKEARHMPAGAKAFVDWMTLSLRETLD